MKRGAIVITSTNKTVPVSRCAACFFIISAGN